MSAARVTDIKSSSTKSFDDAGKIAECRVQMKVTFILADQGASPPSGATIAAQ